MCWRLLARQQLSVRADWSAAMAGVASDFALAGKGRVIEGVHHLDHVASGALEDIVVAVKFPHIVAIRAADAKRDGDVFHRGMELGRRKILEHLDVLKNSPAVLPCMSFALGCCAFRITGLTARPSAAAATANMPPTE